MAALNLRFSLPPPCARYPQTRHFFIQENCLKPVNLEVKGQKFNYKCEANVDVLNPRKPGTAVVWKNSLPSPRVQNIVERNLQSFTLGTTTFLNMYAPSGSNDRRERDNLFSQELFDILAASSPSSLSWLIGHWKCLTEDDQTTASFGDKNYRIYGEGQDKEEGLN